MEELPFKYTHARIVPTVIILVFVFLIFGFAMGYMCADNKPMYRINECQQDPHHFFLPSDPAPKNKLDKDFEKNLVPLPSAVPSGYIVL